MPEIEDLVNYAILIAVAVGIIFMITGKFIDLSVERQLSLQSRITINLLQQIVTEGPFLMTDSHDNKLKLMINKGKYDDEATESLTECCDSVQYNYKFGFSTQFSKQLEDNYVASGYGDSKTNYEGSGEFKRGDFCYTGFGLGLKSAASVPVNVCTSDTNHCDQGIAYIETETSPLSEIAYWIMQACNYEFSLSKRIPLAVDDYDADNSGDGDDLKIDGNKVCLKGTCKKFICDKEIKSSIDDTLYKEQVYNFPGYHTCRFVKILKNEDGMFLVEPKLDSGGPVT